MQVSSALVFGVQELKLTSETATLDAALLLGAVMQVSRAQLLAYPERTLIPAEQEAYQRFIARRKHGEPLAYLVGSKGFWSLDFQVTPATLVPRPETELLVERTLQLFSADEKPRRIADLGTGCGALALALGHERPEWEVHATDRSSAALAVAKQNAAALGIRRVQFYEGNWCAALPLLLFDAILSNPPYLSEAEWGSVPKELSFEPYSALVSGEDGLYDLSEIIRSAKAYLKPGGYLLLEHGCEQGAWVRKILQAEQYSKVSTDCDLAGKERVTLGCWSR